MKKSEIEQAPDGRAQRTREVCSIDWPGSRTIGVGEYLKTYCRHLVFDSVHLPMPPQGQRTPNVACLSGIAQPPYDIMSAQRHMGGAFTPGFLFVVAFPEYPHPTPGGDLPTWPNRISDIVSTMSHGISTYIAVRLLFPEPSKCNRQPILSISCPFLACWVACTWTTPLRLPAS